MNFKLSSEFKPTGDQPQAIEQLKNGILAGERYQTLMGVTGSGKTFTIANMLAELNRPALILSHNKTLAAQLYSEFQQFFPGSVFPDPPVTECVPENSAVIAKSTAGTSPQTGFPAYAIGYVPSDDALSIRFPCDVSHQ